MRLNNEKGMAYVIILFLLIIISSLGLAFISKTGTGLSAVAKRGEAMQAHYLAETAANHALWRLMNESDFPAAEDKYYMHDFAGGRYGYRVKKHTNTTFGAIATVGAMGNNVVHQSYVLHFKPEEAKGGIVWFTDSDPKTVNISKNKVWEDIDLSSDSDIPNGATGVILEIVNESGTNHIGQVRAMGSINYRTLGAEILGGTQIMAFAKLDSAKKFQAYRGNEAVKIYVRGYTGNKATFFVNTDPYYLGKLVGTENIIDFSASGVPGNSIAIIELYAGDSLHVLLRRQGDMSWSAYCQRDRNTHQYVLVGTDSESKIEYTYNGVFTNNAYNAANLVGYIEDVGTWLPSPTWDVSGFFPGTWTLNDITGYTSATADVAFLNVRFNNMSSSARRADVRKPGSSDNQYNYGYHISPDVTSIFSIVGLDSSQRFESIVEDPWIDMHVVGYTEPP